MLDNADPLKAIVESANDLGWPNREVTAGTNADVSPFRRVHALYEANGLLKGAPYVVWDDWDVSLDGGKGNWHGAGLHVMEGPAIFAVVQRIYSYAQLIQDTLLLPGDFFGLSGFSYRLLTTKRVIRFKVRDAGSPEGFSARLETKDGVPVLDVTVPAIEPEEWSELPAATRDAAVAPIFLFRSQLGSGDPLHPSLAETDELKAIIRTLARQVESSQAAEIILSNVADAATRSEPAKSMVVACLVLSSIFFRLTRRLRINSAVYVPGRGFKPSASGGSDEPQEAAEECAGGMYYWATPDTRTSLAALTACESFRCLRSSVGDHARKVADHAKRHAKAAIMSRNFSHNVGSHCLANPRLHSVLGTQESTASQVLSVFHSYAQGRLDFMARTMSGGEERPEPLFFINDVMNGFFRQGVLLDTLVEDLGFPARLLQFDIQLPGEAIVSFTWKPEADGEGVDSTQPHGICRFAAAGARSSLPDVIVGIPGGMIGCHALYAFLENTLRNAVKYGAAREALAATRGRLVITLKLERRKVFSTPRPKDSGVSEAWVVTVTDNVSSDNDDATSDAIRQFISEPLIDEAGLPTSRGHGIQEMKVCAGILAGRLAFGADDEDSACTASSLASSTGVEPLTDASFEGLIRRRLASRGADFRPIRSREPLRCFSEPSSDGTAKLTYQFLLPVPVLLAVAVASQDTQWRRKLPAFVRCCADVDTLVGIGAHFAVLLDRQADDARQIKSVVLRIARIHHLLPFRLIVLTPDADRQMLWRQVLDDETGVVRDGSKVPPRRVRISADTALFQDIDGLRVASADWQEDASTGEGNWEAIILHLYDAWLRAYKNAPPSRDGTWKLAIGFNRPPEQVFGKGSPWDDKVTQFGRKPGNSCIAVLVRALTDMSGDETRSSANWPGGLDLSDAIDAEQASKLDCKSFLIFDNHGAVFPGVHETDVDLSASSRFAQEVGLKQGLSLYQSLESPPATEFGFGWFIYSLVEAALTRIAVMDERFAQACLHGNTQGAILGGAELRFQKAGLFPVFSASRNPQERLFVSDKIKQAAAMRQAGHDDPHWNWEALTRDCDGFTTSEGVCIGNEGASLHVIASAEEMAAVRLLSSVELEADILVFHEGVADVLHRAGLWQDEETWKLYGCAPSVVRTSGRGRDTRHLGVYLKGSLPFLEFSELSEHTYRSLNKLAIARALLGALGEQAGK